MKEPEEPKGDATTHKMKKHKKGLAWCHKKSDKYSECEAKVFLVVKGQWRAVPRKGCKNELDYCEDEKCQEVTNKCIDEFLACLFMCRGNEKLKKKCVNELNDVCLSGNDWHPKCIEEAITHISH